MDLYTAQNGLTWQVIPSQEKGASKEKEGERKEAPHNMLQSFPIFTKLWSNFHLYFLTGSAMSSANAFISASMVQAILSFSLEMALHVQKWMLLSLCVIKGPLCKDLKENFNVKYCFIFPSTLTNLKSYFSLVQNYLYVDFVYFLFKAMVMFMHVSTASIKYVRMCPFWTWKHFEAIYVGF